MYNYLVSIIIPVYNREEIIKATLDSILAQTYTKWECILVDDGSTDNSVHTINTYIKNDKRFKYFKRPETLKKGANSCRNLGFKKSKGSFINWFDSDDIMKPSFLKEKLEAFKTENDAVLHRNKYANYHLTRFRESKFNYSTSKDLFSQYALDKIEIQTCGFMWRKDYLVDKQLFDEDLQRFQDNEFHLRMLSLQPNIKIIETELAVIRGGDGDPSQISHKSNLTKKKLFDVFYMRYQTLKLNKANKSKWHSEIDKIVSKKMLWSFYDALRYEKNIFKRAADVINNYNTLKIVYFNKKIQLADKIKSHLYILNLILFGSLFYKK